MFLLSTYKLQELILILIYLMRRFLMKTNIAILKIFFNVQISSGLTKMFPKRKIYVSLSNILDGYIITIILMKISS